MTNATTLERPAATPAPELLSPTLRALAARLGPELPVQYLYATPTGSGLYEALVEGDGSECAAILQAVRGLRGAALDLGSGGGRLTFPLLAAGFTVTALDNEQEMLDRLAERAAELPPRLADRLHPALADMRNPGLPEGHFSAVVLGTTTVTLLDRSDRISTFGAVARLLTPGGRFLVTTVELSGATTDPPRESSHTLLVPVAGAQHLVTMFETVDHLFGRREVALLDSGVLGKTLTPAVHVNQPYLLPVDELTAELAEAGLRLNSVEYIGALDDRRVALVVAERRS